MNKLNKKIEWNTLKWWILWVWISQCILNLENTFEKYVSLITCRTHKAPKSCYLLPLHLCCLPSAVAPVTANYLGFLMLHLHCCSFVHSVPSALNGFSPIFLTPTCPLRPSFLQTELAALRCVPRHPVQTPLQRTWDYSTDIGFFAVLSQNWLLQGRDCVIWIFAFPAPSRGSQWRK